MSFTMTTRSIFLKTGLFALADALKAAWGAANAPRPWPLRTSSRLRKSLMIWGCEIGDWGSGTGDRGKEQVTKREETPRRCLRHNLLAIFHAETQSTQRAQRCV